MSTYFVSIYKPDVLNPRNTEKSQKFFLDFIYLPECKRVSRGGVREKPTSQGAGSQDFETLTCVKAEAKCYRIEAPRRGAPGSIFDEDTEALRVSNNLA